MNTQVLSKKERIKKWLQKKPVGQAFQPAEAFQPAINYGNLKPLLKEDLSLVHQYRRKLPHWEKEGSTYFITFRVNKALGKPLIESVPAAIVEEALWFGYGERYILDAYVVMPDHVHLLLTPLHSWKLSKILQGIKGYTSREINKILNRKGSFWQDESFDHLIRNEADWLDKFKYIHNNPVNAGLVDRPEDYEFSSLVTMHSKGRLESFGRLESLPHSMKHKYKLIDHTADFGIHVYGSDSKELFANAAWALFDLITEIDRLAGFDSCHIEVYGDDWCDLMVNWLREVLYFWNGKELLVKKARILSLSETQLSATIECDPFNPDRHVIKTEIKAVTYHQIQVTGSPTGWEARIIFDI